MIGCRQKSVLSYLIKPFFILLILFGIFGIIWLRSSIISMEYSISELENEKIDRLKDMKTLMAEEASLLSTQKVEKVAARNLGLTLADRTRVVYVKVGNNGPSKASVSTKYGKYLQNGGLTGKMSEGFEGIYGGRYR
jgi:cell division protein FtsL